MGIWQIGVDELANSRFTVSPLTETVAALITLCGSPALPGMHDWARDHRPRYHRHIADDPFPAAFVGAALRPRSIADFIAVPPRRTDRTFGDELRGVRATPPAVAHRDLALGGTLAPVLGRGPMLNSPTMDETTALAALDEDGFVVLASLLSDEVLDAARRHADDLLDGIG